MQFFAPKIIVTPLTLFSNFRTAQIENRPLPQEALLSEIKNKKTLKSNNSIVKMVKNIVWKEVYNKLDCFGRGKCIYLDV